MPQKLLSSINREDFRGGVSRYRRQTKNQILYCQNARCLSDGTIEVRGGQFLRVDTSDGGSNVGNIETLFVDFSNNNELNFYSVQRHTAGSADLENDLIYLGTTEVGGTLLGRADHFSIDKYKGIVFFSNGLAAIQYHDPDIPGILRTGVVKTGSNSDPPQGQHMIIYKDRMYVGLRNGRVAYSNTGLFETLPEVDFHDDNFQLIGGTNDSVTGLVVGEDFIIAFTAGSYQIMTGTPDDNGEVGTMNWQVYDKIGCLSSRSISSQGRKVVFIGTDRRVYLLEGSVLTDIDPLDNVKEYLTSYNDNTLRTVSSTFNGDEIWFSIPIGYNPVSSRILVYNTVLENWTVFTNIDAFALYFSSSFGKLFVGRNNTLEIFEQGSGDFDRGGSLPTLSFIGRQEPIGTFRKIKSYEKANIQVDMNQDESLTISYALGNSTQFTEFEEGSPITRSGIQWGVKVWGVSVWGGIIPQNKFIHPASGKKGVRSAEMRIKIAGNVSPGTRIRGYEIDAVVDERDGLRI